MSLLVVLGAGESGVGAGVLAQAQGYEVLVSDQGAISAKHQETLNQRGIAWEQMGHKHPDLSKADLVVKSPGIPDTAPLVAQYIAQGVPVISEIELGARYTDRPIVAITGSNGKTTTTLLTHHLVVSDGVSCGLAGNIGNSFAAMVAQDPQPMYVLELSSFQLDGIQTLKPHVAVITNISPDHLDRYQYDINRYISAKFRIAMNQTAEDYLIYDADDSALNDYISKHILASTLIPFSALRALDFGVWMDQGTIHVKLPQAYYTMEVDTLALEGIHNIKNTMAASAAASLVNIRKETIRQSVQTFQGVPHRLESVLKIHHVHYINDSKATNVNAVYYALESVKTPIVWIVGGVDKGNDYMELMPLVREKVKAIVCLGLDNQKIKDTFSNVVDLVVETYDMNECVQVCYKIAERGDTVLLSPACASFDLFKNYEDRGDQFKAAVKNL